MQMYTLMQMDRFLNPGIAMLAVNTIECNSSSEKYVLMSCD